MQRGDVDVFSFADDITEGVKDPQVGGARGTDDQGEGADGIADWKAVCWRAVCMAITLL